MHVIVIDTETNGLFSKTHTPHAVQVSYAVINTSSPFFPIVEDYDAVIRISNDTPLPEESVKIHGITRDITRRRGVPIEHALRMVQAAVMKYKVEVIAGHNVDFDLRVLDAECKRCGLSGLFSNPMPPSSSPDPTSTPSNSSNTCAPSNPSTPMKYGLLGERGAEHVGYCTARESVGVCNFRREREWGYGGVYLKYGKLGEVFDVLFKERDEKRGVELKVFEKYMHNSRVDVLMCVRVYVWLCYSVDVFDAWYCEMEMYCAEERGEFVNVDDGYSVCGRMEVDGWEKEKEKEKEKENEKDTDAGTGTGMDMNVSSWFSCRLCESKSEIKSESKSESESESKSEINGMKCGEKNERIGVGVGDGVNVEGCSESPRRSERLRLKRMVAAM
jgi:hypothetical protein